MSKRFAVAALLLSCPAVHAERVAIPDAGVTFQAPSEFTSLSPEEIAVKFPRRKPPQAAVGDERRTTTIAYQLLDSTIADSALPAVMEAMANTLYRAIPGVEWKRREIVKMAGQSWVWLELTSSAIDTDIYNIVLITPRNGKTLMFNFNTTKELFPIYEAALRASIASIKFE